MIHTGCSPTDSPTTFGPITAPSSACTAAKTSTTFPSERRMLLVKRATISAGIGPKVVGESVGLHPVWIILSLSVAGFFWGFVGLLLAIPLAVLVKLLLQTALERYRRTTLFLGADA